MKSRRPAPKKSKTYYDDDISIAGEATLCKTLKVRSRTRLGENLEVAGNGEINGECTVKGGMEISKGLSVSGEFRGNLRGHFFDGLAVRGRATLQSMYVGDGAVFWGDVRLQGLLQCQEIQTKEKIGVGRLEVSEHAEIGGTLHVKKSIEVDKDVRLNNDVYIKRNLVNCGNAGIHGDLFVEHKAEFAKTLKVSKGIHTSGMSTFGAIICQQGILGLQDAKINKGFTARSIVAETDLKAEIGHFTKEVSAQKAIFDQLRVIDDALVDGGLRVNKSIVSEKDIFANTVDAEEIVSRETIRSKNVLVKNSIKIGRDARINENLLVDGASHLNEVSVNKISLPNGEILSGIYMPNVVSGSNVYYYLPYDAQYMRIGNVVHVSGRIDVENCGNHAHLMLDLPLPTYVRHSHYISGHAISEDGQYHAPIYGSQIHHHADISLPSTENKYALFYMFTYRLSDLPDEQVS